MLDGASVRWSVRDYHALATQVAMQESGAPY